VQNDTDSYNAVILLQERLANNKSSSSLNQKNSRSTSNLSLGTQGSETNSIQNNFEVDGSYFVFYKLFVSRKIISFFFTKTKIPL
jgi:hypothetical protein